MNTHWPGGWVSPIARMNNLQREKENVLILTGIESRLLVWHLIAEVFENYIVNGNQILG